MVRDADVAATIDEAQILDAIQASLRALVVAAPWPRALAALWEGIAVATGGQHLDLAAAGAAPLSVEDCLDIARRKGGALTEACCRAGAGFGSADPAVIERFGILGRCIGFMAQLDND